MSVVIALLFLGIIMGIGWLLERQNKALRVRKNGGE
jgi:hypothetical protein